MGGDLLLSVVWSTKETIDFDAIGVAIRTLTEEQASKIQDLASGNWDDEHGEIDMEGLGDQLVIDLNELKSTWEGNDNRVAYTMKLGPMTVAITGGVSWGDSPTEEFDSWNRLIEAGVLEAGGFFS
jgi:hypothetical protein